jgi:hypothetical protein
MQNLWILHEGEDIQEAGPREGTHVRKAEAEKLH